MCHVISSCCSQLRSVCIPSHSNSAPARHDSVAAHPFCGKLDSWAAHHLTLCQFDNIEARAVQMLRTMPTCLAYACAAQNSYDKPKSHAHFKAEGDVEFKAVLFIPGTAPHDLMDNYYTRKNAVKLYVRRVFISDDFEDLMPKCASHTAKMPMLTWRSSWYHIPLQLTCRATVQKLP